MGIASLIVGIISTACSLFGIYGSGGGLLLGALGIIFGGTAINKNANKGVATAGLVLSCIGATISLVVLTIVGFIGTCISAL